MTAPLTDRYGEYSILSGKEAPGHCFWCGDPVGKRNRYCDQSCQAKYWRHYNLGYARQWCWERHRGVCYECREPIKGKWAAHHITALRRKNRNGRNEWSALNHPDNLVLLCEDCHRAKHRGKPRKEEA